MEQVLHIFRKDVRHLWLPALVVLILVAGHAVFTVRSMPINVPETIRVNAMSSMFGLFVPLGMWFLIALLIFQEALPGDRQFWPTRPYRWPKLLASKVLFIAVFINAPLFLSDCYILGAQGFAVLSVLPSLLLRQLLVTALFILPPFAIATVTAGVAQFVLAWFILLLALIFENVLATSFLGSSIGFDIGTGSIFIATLAVTTCAIVIWQYARRRTMAARLVSLAAVCAFLPVTWGLSLAMSHFKTTLSKRAQSPDESNVRIAYDLAATLHNSRTWRPPSEFVNGRLRLIVVGLPPKTLLRGTCQTTLDVGGTAWPHSGGFVASSLQGNGDDYWQMLDLEASKLYILKQHLANLHTLFDLEIVGDEVETRVPLTKRSFFVHGLGLCFAFQGTAQKQYACRAGLEPSVETTARMDSPNGPLPIGPFPRHSIPWGLSPTTDLMSFSFSSAQQGSELVFIPHRKIAQFQRTLDAQNVQLTNYLLPH